MELIENYSLKNLTTFRVDCKAEYFCELSDVDELSEVLQLSKSLKRPILFLGGGSNILFIKDVELIVVKVNNRGIEILHEDEDSVEIEVASGEDWDKLVEYTVSKGWGGIENLSLIPGTVGAAPIQNIGAYGVELKDVIVSVNAIILDSMVNKVFEIDECNFGYRDSIFKNELKNKFFIHSVNLKLSKNPNLKTEYGSIKEELIRQDIKYPNLVDIRKVICDIRKSKLPDPKEIGNAGSFFKNPVVEKSTSEKILLEYPEVPTYRISDNEVKIPAGWLIEKSGLKGKRSGETGIHKDQALVIVNYGNATGEEIVKFKEFVKQTVYEKFNILLQEEVNIL
jgi:UDP-N-acetylmuramate dehydrogenase